MYYLISLEDDSRFFAFNYAQSLDSIILSFSIYDSTCVFDEWELDK